MNDLPSALRDTQQSITHVNISGNAYDFGFDNPQYSDRVLQIWQEKDYNVGESQSAAKQALAHPRLLRSMHVNSLTLAANSEVFR